jgi:hypothetical protein
MCAVYCNYCGKPVTQRQGAINRALKHGRGIYCNRECSGLGRRSNKTPEQKKEEKRLYDLEYRNNNKEVLKAKKAEYHKLTYDVLSAKEKRKLRAAQHAEYCRQPEYKAWKKTYDQQHRAKKLFGEYWESAILLINLDNEIDARMDKYEIYAINGTLNKKQTRRRDYERTHSNQS